MRILERPWIDFVISGAILGSVVLAARQTVELDPFGAIPRADRLSLYGHLLTAISLSLAVAGVALAAYTSSNGPRVAMVRAVAGTRMRRQFTAALTGPALCAAAILVAFGLEAGGDGWSRWIAVGALLFLGTRTVRLIYFFVGLLRLTDEDHEALPDERLPSLDDQPVSRLRR